ncbi:hypothetical protein AND_000516 [Anopheles darlingi]|uniref:Uncharacterized protein n=1 Tax=Anopheles darlingi TaxID=43151 RepID=W5JU53_ANODA|nr:hypothetical protein AND_000516 [Anopheles darlingi]
MQATDKDGAAKAMAATVTGKDMAEDMVIIIANISEGLEEEEVATRLVTILPIITDDYGYGGYDGGYMNGGRPGGPRGGGKGAAGGYGGGKQRGGGGSGRQPRHTPY